MAQFLSPNPKLEVHVLLVNALLEVIGKNSRLENILYAEGIILKDKKEWYSLQNYLNILKVISQEYNPNTLFRLGKSIGKSLRFSNKITSIKAGLEALESSMQNIHQLGSIGSYRLIKFDENRQEARFECKNPYPCYFDRGLITQITKYFMPKNASLVNVELNSGMPSRLAGSDKSFYTIFWM